jgi:hypothetical protein
MARFIVSHRTAASGGRRKETAAALAQFAPSLRRFAKVSAESAPGEKRRGMYIVEADAREIEQRRKELPPGILVEPVLRRTPARFRPALLAGRPPENATDPAVGIGASCTLTIRGNGKPLSDASVSVLFANSGNGVQIPVIAKTDEQGKAAAAYNPNFWYPAMAIVTPQADFWSACLRWPIASEVDLIPVARTGPLGWWHSLLGESQWDASRGAGIRIGFADTGCGPHPNLAHCRGIGAFVNGGHRAGAGTSNDVAEHGTHVGGILGARPAGGSTDFSGIAPGAEISFARVYDKAADGALEPEANNGDIAAAIDTLVHDERVDLLNLSLGGSRGSQIEQDAIDGAIDEGVLVICAAGNSGGPVIYPAAYPGCVAVTAIGLAGTVPASSVDALVYSQPGSDGIYAAAFNNAGPQVACAGPGVGIISTVPANAKDRAPTMAMTGTSMAAPAVCAALATILARDKQYRSMPRDRSRAVYAWQTLARSLRATSAGGVGWGLATAI